MKRKQSLMQKHGVTESDLDTLKEAQAMSRETGQDFTVCIMHCVHNAALEEAAKVAEDSYPHVGYPTEDERVAKVIAVAIRALKKGRE